MVAAVEVGRDGEKVDGERRVLLGGVSWSAYVGLRDSVKSRTVHMTYLKGALEIMTVGRAHEVPRKQIARLLELFCLERGIPLFGYGGMTLGVREVWVFQAKLGSFELFSLRGGRYERINQSEVLPEAPLDRIAHYAPEIDQHAALVAFRGELRAR